MASVVATPVVATVTTVAQAPEAIAEVPRVKVPEPTRTPTAPAEPLATPSAVATPVPNPLTPVAIGRFVAFVSVSVVGVPKFPVVNVGLVSVLFVSVCVAVMLAKDVRQLKPVPVVHCNADEGVMHEGTAKPLGVVAVTAPSIVLAVCVARLALGTLPVMPVAGTEVAAIVPDPETARLAPVPTTMAAVELVELVSAENAEEPPLAATQVQTAGLAAVQERKVLPVVGCAPGNSTV